MPESTPPGKSLPVTLQEVWQLVLAYVKQETVEPLRDLGRFLAFGVAGSVVVGLGLSLLLLGGLRLLQTETGDAFEGNWSWVPYLTVLAAAGVAIALALAARARSTKGARR